MYQIIKRIVIHVLPKLQKPFEEFHVAFSTRKFMGSLMHNKKIPKLSNEETKEVKLYFKSKGYTLKNTYWHAYYKAMNGEFHKDYIPYDIFKPQIIPRLNQKRQWPALMDKNLLYKIFEGYEQPKRVIQNMNGFYYVDDKIVDGTEAIKACNANHNHLIIKPAIGTCQGKMVNAFTAKDFKTSYKNLSIKELFALYHKDFIVQEFLEQSAILSALNPSSLNTIRVVSYLNDHGVHILASVLRIGKPGSVTDNYSTGGLICGILNDGKLKGKGYNPKREIFTKTHTGVILKDCKIPNYDKLLEMTKAMHYRVPYFRIISWDIAINKNNMPVLIEYNTNNQGIDVQIASGPLFREFTDEILALGIKPY